ncbi:MAG: ElyC/SanA/YdcF family protein [Candidatus Omnitrophota bacterium]
MFKNQNIICFSSIDWDFLWQANQEIMLTLADNGNRILFIENTGIRPVNFSDIPRIKKRISNWLKSVKGFRKQSDNLYIYSPILLPFPYSIPARFINRSILIPSLRRWLDCIEFHDPIIWSFLPTPLCLDIIKNIKHRAVVYYNIDNLSATSLGAKKIVKFERQMAYKSDIVFAMSKKMFDYLSKFNKNTIRIPAGVNVGRFIDMGDNDMERPAELRGIKTKIIGYVGGIRKSIDIELVKYLLKGLPDFTFVFVGPIQIDIAQLSIYKNIIFVGQKNHEVLPFYIRHFDACIIPYIKDDYANNVSPAKLNEYLAMGKPVIASDIDEVKNFCLEHEKSIYVAKDYQDFLNLILDAIRQNNQYLRNERIEIAQNNSWLKKIEEMSEAIENTVKKKEADAAKSWENKLINVYKMVRFRVFRAICVLSLIWLLVFYTPFIWILAEPLKISQPPEKSDAIVVLAGGAGESGVPGQGYEERVQEAVDLYKNGYAKYIIFSSGDTYRLKETLLMKNLAISYGISEEAVILEDRAKNTYENIKFSKDILEKNNWNKIILVSSPYHMLRVSLTAKNIMPHISSIYVPIRESRFYMRSTANYGKKTYKQINVRQIAALLHEYVGIMYYWWKGWI